MNIPTRRPPLPVRLRAACVGLIGLLWAGAVMAADIGALVTILDGDATVIDDDRAMAAVEGLKVDAQALVITGARTNLLRLEWPDGSVVDLGPDTEAMVGPVGFGARDKQPPAIYLLKGWAKVGNGNAKTTPGQLTPDLDLPAFKGVIVTFVDDKQTWVFAETGDAKVAERGRGGGSFAIQRGQVFTRAAGAKSKGSVAERPTPEELHRVPVGFRDALPLRADAFKDRQPEVKNLPPPSYDELRDWLMAEPALRRRFPKRFAKRLKDAAFRNQVTQRLVAHPEWTDLIYPPQPK